jgi:hypothetical protein
VIITIIILSLLVIFLIYSTFNLLRKLELYEDTIEESDKNLVGIEQELIKVVNNLRRVDSKGIFEDDDEVGQTFKQILKIIEGLEK